jgi:hypothetical protein
MSPPERRAAAGKTQILGCALFAQHFPRKEKNAMTELKGKRVAILVTDGFEQMELTSPKEALEKAGAKCVIVAPKDG